MNTKLLHRVRIARLSATRTSSGRALPLTDGYRHSAAGHGSRMPSQRVTTRMQRPY